MTTTRTLCLMLLLLAGPRAAAESETQTYEKIALAPSAFAREEYLRFTMRYAGITDVDPAFAPIGRTSASHVQLVARKPRGARNPLPVFLAKSKSHLLRTLRNSPGNTYHLFRGRVRYFKVPVYTPESFLQAKGPSLKAEGLQAQWLTGFYGKTSVDKVEFQPREKAKPQGYSVYYLLDIFEIRPMPAQAKLPPTKPTPAQKYQPVRPAQVVAQGKQLAGKPIQFQMRYSGRLGRLLQLKDGLKVASRFALPKTSCVKQSNLGRIDDPTGGLEVLTPPGPLGKLVVIGFGKDWDLAADLAKANTGDMLEVSGVLYPAGEQSGARFLFVLEGVELAAARKPTPFKRRR